MWAPRLRTGLNLSKRETHLPFRWDLTRRNQLGSLVGPTLHPDSTILLEPLLPCAARTLAFAGDADLVFVGRSPENLFDLLSGLLFDCPWFERLTLLHFSMRRIDPKTDARYRTGLPALRAYLQKLALDPAGLAARKRAVTLIDWVDTGGTFGNLVKLLHEWSPESGADWSEVRRRLRIVGITEKTHTSPNTWRWHQHAKWIGLLTRGAVKNVPLPAEWWHLFAQQQYKVSPSHTPDRWAAADVGQPGRNENQLAALRVAHGVFELGRTKKARQRFASLLVREPAMKETWYRDLVRELRG